LVAVLELIVARSSWSTAQVVGNDASAQPEGAAVTVNVSGPGSEVKLVTVMLVAEGVSVSDVQFPTPVGSGVTPLGVFEMFGPAEKPPGVSTIWLQ
jgi:hypothetical protein